MTSFLDWIKQASDEAGLEPKEDIEDQQPQLPQPKSLTLDDFPEHVAPVQVLNLSGLSERSHGNGRKRNTVIHAICIKPIQSGRLQRRTNEFLCGLKRGRKSFGYREAISSDVDCPRCAATIQRHGLSVCRDQSLGRLIQSY